MGSSLSCEEEINFMQQAKHWRDEFTPGCTRSSGRGGQISRRFTWLRYKVTEKLQK